MGMSDMASKIDPLYLALLHQRNNDYEKCVDICTEMLEKNPVDEAVWSLKTRAMTAQVKSDYMRSHI
jgi:tetratricopeptide repeat protein 8